MACELIELPGMGIGITCSRGVRPKRCQFCGADCTKECDYPSAKRSGTCDARMCDAHATAGGGSLDYCPEHAPFVFAVGGHRLIVANLRSVKDGVRIDRGHSLLGNPFRLESESQRAECLERYRRWLWDHLKNAFSEPSQEIVRLAEEVKICDVTLLCWCAPKLCHGQVVARAIKWIVEREAA